VIQYGKYGVLLSMDFLGNRWGWERTKVWRFFQKHACTFGLHRMPGAYGSLIFNLAYFGDDRDTMPSEGKIMFLLGKIREASRKGIAANSDRDRVNRMIAWNSRKVLHALETSCDVLSPKGRVAHSDSNTRAYFSHGRNCKYGRNCISDCQGMILGDQKWQDEMIQLMLLMIRAGPDPPVKLLMTIF
jgi:hypothetical protein